MKDDWQTWAAGGVVLGTVLIFLSRSLKGRLGKGKAKGGCGSCGCSSTAVPVKLPKR
jgi:hypothetical protein